MRSGARTTTLLLVVALLTPRARAAPTLDADAVIADLLARDAPGGDWLAVSKATRRATPSWWDEAGDRFRKEPDLLLQVLYALPGDGDVVQKVESQYAAQRAAPSWTAEDREQVHRWLMRYSPSFRDDLLAAVAEGERTADSPNAQGRWALEALESVDEQRALSILRQRVADRSPETSTWAVTRLYAHATGTEAEEWRSRLQARAIAPDASDEERKLCLASLSGAPWKGDQAWFLGLFHDARMVAYDRSNGDTLQLLVTAHPEGWIPCLVPLVGGTDSAARAQAVHCLAHLLGEHAREDALRPLLPWLADPAWASTGGEFDRALVLENPLLGKLADTPLLLTALQKGTEREIAAAALLLARRGDVRAAPGLWEVLDRRLSAHAADGDWSEWATQEADSALLAALRSCGGLDPAEEAKWVEAGAGSPAAVRTREALLGKLLLDGLANPPWIESLDARADALTATRPELAARLRAIVESSHGPAAYRRLLARLHARSLDAKEIARLLEEREQIVAAVPEQVRALLADRGLAHGVAAALLAEPAVVAAVFVSPDVEARRALLVCARLGRVALPEPAVIALLVQADAPLAQAAERYLEAWDSPGAQAALLSRSPGQARILGAALGPRWIADLEEQLRGEVLADQGPDVVYALSADSAWFPPRSWIVRRHRETWTLEFRQRAEPPVRQSIEAEAQHALEAALEDLPPEGLPGYDSGILCGARFEVVRILKAGGRRVRMNNPGFRGSDWTPGWTDAYSRLVDAFCALHRPKKT